NYLVHSQRVSPELFISIRIVAKDLTTCRNRLRVGPAGALSIAAREEKSTCKSNRTRSKIAARQHLPSPVIGVVRRSVFCRDCLRRSCEPGTPVPRSRRAS